MDEKISIERAGRFIFVLAITFLLLNFAISLLQVTWFEMFYAQGTALILSLFGFASEVVEGDPVLVYLSVFTIPLGFSYLCTGLLELSFLLSAIIATPEQKLKKKLKGIAMGLVVLVIFNFARILTSVLLIYYLGLGVGVFSHDVLFRVFLFAVIIGYYYIWLTKTN